MKKGGLRAEGVAGLLGRHRGNMAAVARHYGVSRQAVWDFVSRRAGLEAVARECRESMKDDGEGALYAAVLKGEAWAVCFCQAKGRGYTLRGQDWHILKALELMDEQSGGLLLVIGRHLVEALVDGRLELLEGIKPG